MVRWALDVDPDDVSATATLFDVFPVDVVAELGLQFFEKVLRGVAVIRVGDEVDVVALGRVFDGFDRLTKDEVRVVAVFRLFEVGRPGVVVNVVGDGFRIMVVVVIM